MNRLTHGPGWVKAPIIKDKELDFLSIENQYLRNNA